MRAIVADVYSCFGMHGLRLRTIAHPASSRSRNRFLSPELQKKIVDGVLEEVGSRSFEELSQKRDNLTIGLLELLSHGAVRLNR